MEPEIYTNILRNLSENLRAKLPAPTYTHGYSMVKIACLNDAFSEFFELEESLVEGQSLQDKKRRKRKSKTNFKKRKKPKGIGHSLVSLLSY